MSPLVTFVASFLAVSLATALVTAMIRQRQPRQVVQEATSFFLMLTVGIAGLCAVVYVLEWIFIRPLL